MKKTWVTIDELAVELGVSVKSIRRAYRKGQIPVERICRFVRFDLDRVKAAMQANGQGQSPLRRENRDSAARPAAPAGGARSGPAPDWVRRGRLSHRSQGEEMTGSGGFTQTIDWLAFTLPKGEVADVITLIGGDWFQSESGFRGYPVAQLMTEGKTGVGKLGTGAPRNPKEVHVDLSAGIVSQWDETKLKTVLAWIFAQKGHVTRIDVALDDREASVAVETVRLAVEAGQLVSRSKQFKVIQASNHREGTRTGETLYFGSRESQSMLRVYDKRLELQAKGREDAALYGVRWELEFKQDRAQACAKALLTLDAEDWRAFLVGVLRSYVDFRETTREAESYEKYRAPLVGWWKALTEGFMRCRLVVERIQQRLDDVAAWLANAISPMLAVVVACRGDQFLFEMIYAGTKRWTQKHYALLKQRKRGTPYVLRVS